MACCSGMVIANLSLIHCIFVKHFLAHKIHFTCVYVMRQIMFQAADHNFICLWTDLHYKGRISECESQPLALSYCIMNNSFMLSQNMSTYIHKVPGNRWFPCCLLDIGSIITIRYKTYFHAIRLVSYWQPHFLCDLTHPFFFIFTDRHQCSSKLFLRQVV